MRPAPGRGTILGGTVAVPDLAQALALYRDAFGLELVEQGPLPADLAASWGCPGVAGVRHAVLQPTSGAPFTLRLVEQPAHADYRPTRSFGWAAFELTVEDVYGWETRLAGIKDLEAEIVGRPHDIPSMPYFVAMQLIGPGGEMLYLNEVRGNTPTADLPHAASPIDRMFIAVLAAPDRAAAFAWYRDTLRLDDGGSFAIPYTMINRAFDLPRDTPHEISLVQAGRMPVLEIDSYPSAATPRARHAGMLPPGNALVTLAVDRLPRAEDFIAPPAIRDGRRTACVIGPAGELLELVEI